MRRVTRRSSRIKNKTQGPTRTVTGNASAPDASVQECESEAYSESENESSEDEGAHTPLRKRRKIETHRGRAITTTTTTSSRPAPRQVKGRKGVLQYMNEIPLDIIYEIFGNLEPVDLLQLSWVSKRLNAIVMGTQARFLWINAFKAICSRKNGPPPCPKDLNLAQYARFLFTKRCMICHIATAFYFSWGLRLTTCWNCLQTKHFVASDSVSRDLSSIIHQITAKRKSFYVQTSVARLSGLHHKDKLWLKQVKELRRTSRGEDKYIQWRRTAEYERKLEPKKIRQEAILEKLAQLGWSKQEVVKYIRNLRRLPTFNNVAKLTEKEWDKLRPLMLFELERTRTYWQSNRVDENYHEFITVANGWTPAPLYGLRFRAHLSEFIVHEPFTSIIQDYDNKPNFKLDQDMTSTLSKINAECLRKRNEILFALLPADIRDRGAKLNEPYTVLQSAVVWFHNTSKRDGFKEMPMDYVATLQDATEVLTLLCKENDPGIYRKLFGILLFRPWEMYSERFSFNHKAYDLTRKLVQLCGKDPYTATSGKMAMDSTPISCTLCEEQEKLTYSTAVQHAFDNHRECLTWEDIFRVGVE